jgi:hypothetical protein
MLRLGDARHFATLGQRHAIFSENTQATHMANRIYYSVGKKKGFSLENVYGKVFSTRLMGLKGDGRTSIHIDY